MTNPLPESLIKLDKDEFEDRVQKMDDSILIIDENKISLQGTIEIHLDFTEDRTFKLGSWITIDKRTFNETMENAQKSELAVVEGKLDCKIPFYQKINGLKAKGIINFLNHSIQITVTENSPIKTDQENPISKERFIELMNLIHHMEIKEEVILFKKSFYTRTKNILNQFKSNNIPPDLIIDISSQTEVLFQIVNRISLEEIDNIKDGFGLHLAFDDIDEQNVIYFNNLMASSIFSSKFKHYKLDEVDIYQIDFKNDIEELISIITEIIIQVYLENPETIKIELL